MDNEIVKNVELINKLPGLLKVKKEVKSIYSQCSKSTNAIYLVLLFILGPTI